ncbi:Hsp20 family protein [Nibribacter ruber]|uniref:Hsp20 family protein n=2 Tax=Nibribacter ruber TaxID=2698458 RepID=A0A6P1P523_9BACT|nr:Hsp20 family protein [Nibribacter ruber]
MPQTFSSLLDNFFNEAVTSRKAVGFTPQVDLWETKEAYAVEVALPGLKKEDIHVEFQEGVLTVSGERKQREESQEQKYRRVESNYGKFSRSFQLPEQVDGAAINAQFENGVLHISLLKVEVKVVKHQISVK